MSWRCVCSNLLSPELTKPPLIKLNLTEITFPTKIKLETTHETIPQWGTDVDPNEGFTIFSASSAASEEGHDENDAADDDEDD